MVHALTLTGKRAFVLSRVNSILRNYGEVAQGSPVGYENNLVRLLPEKSECTADGIPTSFHF